LKKPHIDKNKAIQPSSNKAKIKNIQNEKDDEEDTDEDTDEELLTMKLMPVKPEVKEIDDKQSISKVERIKLTAKQKVIFDETGQEKEENTFDYIQTAVDKMQERDQIDKRAYNEKLRQQRRARKRKEKLQNKAVFGGAHLADTNNEDYEQTFDQNDFEQYQSESEESENELEVDLSTNTNHKRKLHEKADAKSNKKQKSNTVMDDEEIALQLLHNSTK